VADFGVVVRGAVADPTGAEAAVEGAAADPVTAAMVVMAVEGAEAAGVAAAECTVIGPAK
jgi:hypothetical protein